MTHPHTCGPSDYTRILGEEACTEALVQMWHSGVPFLVGGTYALRQHTQTGRRSKDLDVFVLEVDVDRVLTHFRDLGYATSRPFPHWLGKVFVGDLLIDVIFSSGNGMARVDELWFAHASVGTVCDVQVRLSPPEEMIWSKAFVQERERFDGADVVHLLRHKGATLDWPRLLRRFGPHWRVLLGHLVAFGFVYPDLRNLVPAWVLRQLTTRLIDEQPDASTGVCNGTLLSREQYLEDVRGGYYIDGRLEPFGNMTRDEIDIWTKAIGGED